MKMLNPPPGLGDPIKLLHSLHTVGESDWIRRGEESALELFHRMSEDVPAYKDFLKSKKFKARNVQQISDFNKIPLIDKDNYLRKYPLEMLMWNGDFRRKRWVVSATSGSTGEPFYFPRQREQDWQYATLAEMYLRHNFDIDKKSTLYIVAFPMGAWIGGVFTYQALQLLADRGGYNLSVITPGINKLEVINAVKKLGEKFDQIIIGSYAPFLKDILDDGRREGVKWNKYNLGFVFSAEAFSEDFRDFVVSSAGLKNTFTSTLNHYGTVDMGTMAHETPISILIRRTAFDNEMIRTKLFPEPLKQPTLTQYLPELYYFEEIDTNLVCSSRSGIPLVRYDLKDFGGLLSRAEIDLSMEEAGYSLTDLIHKSGIKKQPWNLPFVYVYERNDFSVSYYAFLVYPDTFRRALQGSRFNKQLTGKFTALVEYDKTGRQKLIVNIELMHGKSATKLLESRVASVLHSCLFNESSEYREVFRMIGNVAKPHATFWPYEDSAFFKPGTKQKWIVK